MRFKICRILHAPARLVSCRELPTTFGTSSSSLSLRARRMYQSYHDWCTFCFTKETDRSFPHLFSLLVLQLSQSQFFRNSTKKWPFNNFSGAQHTQLSPVSQCNWKLLLRRETTWCCRVEARVQGFFSWTSVPIFQNLSSVFIGTFGSTSVLFWHLKAAYFLLRIDYCIFYHFKINQCLDHFKINQCLDHFELKSSYFYVVLMSVQW